MQNSNLRVIFQKKAYVCSFLTPSWLRMDRGAQILSARNPNPFEECFEVQILEWSMSMYWNWPKKHQNKMVASLDHFI